jgi:outer membrane protein
MNMRLPGALKKRRSLPLLVFASAASAIAAGPPLLHTYEPPQIASLPSADSSHIRLLIRGGNLYLTAKDAIAIAIDNDITLAIARYDPMLASYAIERAEAGGLLRGVTNANSLIGSVASGQGVAGSQASAGLANLGSISTSNKGNATVTQIGPVTPNLDPVIDGAMAFSHTTAPQSNVVLSQTSALVALTRNYTLATQQGFTSGAIATMTWNESDLKENSPSDVLNPSVAPRLSLAVTQNLLQGFGTGVNTRFVRAAKLGREASDEVFRGRVIDEVTNVLNLYWDLSLAENDLEYKRENVALATKFESDLQQEIAIGAVARNDLVRAQSDAAARELELANSETLVRQRTVALKAVLSRFGSEDPLLQDAGIITLDRPNVPEEENLPSTHAMIEAAKRNRPDMVLARINGQSTEVLASGTANGILPQLQVFANTTQSGLSGTPNTASGVEADPYFRGGLGNAAGQVFRRNFPYERIGVSGSADLKNNIAQGDYGVDQLQLRQSQLVARRNASQAAADIASESLALRLARSRYANATRARAIQEEVARGEQQKQSLGKATIYDVVQARRDLAVAQSNELAAAAAYIRNHIALDQVLGVTLERNGVRLH